MFETEKVTEDTDIETSAALTITNGSQETSTQVVEETTSTEEPETTTQTRDTTTMAPVETTIETTTEVVFKDETTQTEEPIVETRTTEIVDTEKGIQLIIAFLFILCVSVQDTSIFHSTTSFYDLYGIRYINQSTSYINQKLRNHNSILL